MLEVICPNSFCKKINQFPHGNPMPEECYYCCEVFPPSVCISDASEQNGASAAGGEDAEVSGLVLIYQIDQRQIQIDVSERTILGRKSYGSEVLGTIFFNEKSVISRQHCSIEFRNGDFYLRDENSLNGTFYGVKKINCKNSPQKIENNGILYLGEEPFVARIIHKVPETVARNEAEAFNEEQERATFYRCNNCGLEKPEKLSMCPTCDTYNSFADIFEKKS